MKDFFVRYQRSTIICSSRCHTTHSFMSSTISIVPDSQMSLIPSSDDGLSEIGIPISSDLSIPGDLEYADNAKTCILYEEDSRQAFYAWWCRTPWATNMANKNSQGKSTMSWTTKGKNAQCWKNFNQIAVAKTGCPKLQCIICGSLLEHPSPKNTGSNSMTRHLSRRNCKERVEDAKTETGQSIRLSFSKQEVCRF